MCARTAAESAAEPGRGSSFNTALAFMASDEIMAAYCDIRTQGSRSEGLVRRQKRCATQPCLHARLVVQRRADGNAVRVDDEHALHAWAHSEAVAQTSREGVRGLRLWSLHCSTATGWLEETGATRAAATLLTGVGADALERLLNLRGRLAEWVWGAGQHRTAVQAHDRGRPRTHHVSTRYQADSQLERHGAEVVRLGDKWCSATVDASGG